MACMKLGSKSDAFQRHGQAWFCTTGLPSDIVVEVGEMSFHLHKFPLLSGSGVIDQAALEDLEIEKLGKTAKGGGGGLRSGSKTWFGIKLKSHQMRSAQEGSLSKSNNENVTIEKLKDVERTSWKA
ncbi:unnamed protein product [Eruca vesicaria subsp. sativa]|uniref:BTB/POZ domain-containing protein n=1 Tax=Eruca vesicaria subsp. sativa TaxID=29727 RepID=A0ABC8L147_ERUVS|nr:unnamed protein product [Eruca vesicaria subsp. sativa]